jgi:hypothetical protein
VSARERRREPLFAAVIAVVLGALAAAPSAAQLEDEAAALAEEAVEVVDVNRASLEELLAIPGFEPALARTLLAARDRAGGFRTFDDALARLDDDGRARLLEFRAWLDVEPLFPGGELRVALASRGTTTGRRRDGDLLARRGRVAVAARLREDGVDGGAPDRRATAALRLAGPAGLSLMAGDVAPVESFGLLFGTGSGLFAGNSLAAGRGLDRSPWRLDTTADLGRLPPSPAARRLRGAALDWRGRIDVGVFQQEAQEAAATVGDEPAPPPSWLLAGVRWPRGAGRGAGVRVALWGGRPWLSLDAGGTLGGAAVRGELARDPAGRSRRAFRIAHEPGARLAVELAHRSSAPDFVSPLGFDAEAVPSAADRLDEGRNAGESLTALRVRGRLCSRLGLEGEVANRLEPARSRRPFDRPVGAARVGLRWSAATGTLVLAEWRFENRGAPGPSSIVESPERRHAARLSLSCDRKTVRFRADWSGRIDLATEAGDPTARLVAARDVVSLRGRWLLPRGFWIGGGVARHDLASGASAVVYEERPPGPGPSVTVHGSGRRWHLALGLDSGPLRAGAFVTRGDPASGTPRTLGGVSLRLALGGAL